MVITLLWRAFTSCETTLMDIENTDLITYLLTSESCLFSHAVLLARLWLLCSMAVNLMPILSSCDLSDEARRLGTPPPPKNHINIINYFTPK